jgi:hypothetical protein
MMFQFYFLFATAVLSLVEADVLVDDDPNENVEVMRTPPLMGDWWVFGGSRFLETHSNILKENGVIEGLQKYGSADNDTGLTPGTTGS